MKLLSIISFGLFVLFGSLFIYAKSNEVKKPIPYTIRINKGKVFSHHHFYLDVVSFTLIEGNREVATFKDSVLNEIIIQDNQ